MFRRLGTGMVIVGMVLAGCGEQSKPQSRAHSAPAASATPSATETATAARTITFCSPQPGRGERGAVRRFNAEHHADGVRVRLRRLPLQAQDAHDFAARHLGSGCDAAELDVAWIGEFAAFGRLLDVTDYVTPRSDEFIGRMLETARYDGHYWGVPRWADAGVLYYRRSAGGPPSTWQEVYALARKGDGIVYQGMPDEPLTINFLEIAYAAGGRVLSRDGRRSVLDSPQNRRALEFMRGGIASGAAADGVVELDAEGARRAFENGHATFMRNWPYAYALLNAHGSPVEWRFSVAPLPAFGGRERSGVLMGSDLVVAAQTDERDAALAFVDFITGPEETAHALRFSAVAPALKEAFSPAEMDAVLPHYVPIRQTLEVARPRPVTPAWPAISQAIARNVRAALEGRISTRAALRAADRETTKALAAGP